LMLVMMMLFTGVEYVLAYMDFSSTRYPVISYLVLGTLPLITLLQVWSTIDLEDKQWAILFGIVLLAYLMIAYFFNRYQKNQLVDNITMALSGFFGILAVVLWFGGDIKALALAVLALLYYWLSRWEESIFVRFVGHTIAGIGIIWAIKELWTMGGSSDPMIFIVQLLIISALMGCLLLNDRLERQVFGSVLMGLYVMPVLVGKAYNLTEDWEPIAVAVVVYGLFIIGLYWIDKVWKVMFRGVFLALCILPFIAKLLSGGEVVDNNIVKGWETAAFVVYSFILYGLVWWAGKDIPEKLRVVLKTSAYGILHLTLLMDISVSADGFAYGLIGSGGLIALQHYIEPDKDLPWMTRILRAMRLGWLLALVVYGIILQGRESYLWLRMIADGALVAITFWQLQELKIKIPALVRTALHGLVFMVFVYGNFDMLEAGRGIITLLWAAYAIVLLSHSVIKSNKHQVTLSMGFIVVVAVKFVLIDLATVSTVWKIIVSMSFGSALLLISYLLHPLLSTKNDQKS